MSEKQVWFARRKPVGRALAPGSWQGRPVMVAFLIATQIGGLWFLTFAQRGAVVLGVTAFVVLAVLGACGFQIALHAKGDTTRTVAEYRKAKQVA
jgi:hypothetical protein